MLTVILLQRISILHRRNKNGKKLVVHVSGTAVPLVAHIDMYTFVDVYVPEKKAAGLTLNWYYCVMCVETVETTQCFQYFYYSIHQTVTHERVLCVVYSKRTHKHFHVNMSANMLGTWIFSSDLKNMIVMEQNVVFKMAKKLFYDHLQLGSSMWILSIFLSYSNPRLGLWK